MMPAYATVEQLQSAADFQTTAFEKRRLRRILQSASRAVEDYTHRRFYPLTQTVDYHDPTSVTIQRADTAGFWLEDDLLSLTALTVDGTAETVADVFLYPKQYGPPYSWIGISGYEISITGVFGYSQDTEPAGALAEDLDDSETDVDVTDSASVGIGDLLTVGTERMLVEDKSLLDTGQNLGANLSADVADDTVDLGDGTAFVEGEILTIDSERMKLVDIAGNNGIVIRAYDGSRLAAHTTGADIYAPRTLTVERGAAGTTAATHSTSDAITRNVPPAPITDLCIAEALVRYEQEASAYGRTVGSGENQREARGVGLAQARKDALAYRRNRMAAI